MSTERVLLEGDQVAACPECDSAPVVKRVGGAGHENQTTEPYACYGCSWRGSEYRSRAEKTRSGNRNGLSEIGKAALNDDTDQVSRR